MTEKSAADRVLELGEKLWASKPRSDERYTLSLRFEFACVDLAPALARQVKELEAERGWRPIESAPKDGTSILIYAPSWADPIRVAHWSEECEHGEFVTDEGWQIFVCDDGHYSVGMCFADATHWKPLPEPPK